MVSSHEKQISCVMPNFLPAAFKLIKLSLGGYSCRKVVQFVHNQPVITVILPGDKTKVRGQHGNA